ncbi:cytidylyltransferase domain-containing protein [Flavobacterium sp. B183]|uniref:acylneuraminate cytidylyltransferase family protein n=1 Tax=Flavobacterium sp. B183 TaxID=907046 RepID=UPI00201EDC42|nr:acylneuraminate cytidylyltransferase family protein [Flavobacterium sp. B183]URC13076.1 acylneuraminate cytidylyltransferase family protein [Flavobacterium sp. B183]
MKNIVIIPARGGSKRLPQKNVKLLDGMPLLSFSILFAKTNSEIIDEVYVSTDDKDIKKIALEYGAKVIDRPENISGDFEPTVSALKHVLESIDTEVENVILLQATNPFRPDNLLKDAFKIYQKENFNSLFTVSRNHKKLGKIIDQKFVPYNYEIGQRSQDLEPLYFENGLLYITKASLILQDIIIAEDAFPFEIDHIFANVDIDTQEDFDYTEYLYHIYIKP